MCWSWLSKKKSTRILWEYKQEETWRLFPSKDLSTLEKISSKSPNIPVVAKLRCMNDESFVIDFVRNTIRSTAKRDELPIRKKELKWECQANEGWIPYPQEYNDIISAHYLQSPSKPFESRFTFCGVAANYKIDFGQMVQINLQTSVKRSIRHGAPDIAVREQCEYYFSDRNLMKDDFLRNKIEQANDGWVSIDLILGFGRMRKLGATEADVRRALQTSTTVETRQGFIRRLNGRPLPPHAGPFL